MKRSAPADLTDLVQKGQFQIWLTWYRKVSSCWFDWPGTGKSVPAFLTELLLLLLKKRKCSFCFSCPRTRHWFLLFDGFGAKEKDDFLLLWLTWCKRSAPAVLTAPMQKVSSFCFDWPGGNVTSCWFDYLRQRSVCCSDWKKEIIFCCCLDWLGATDCLLFKNGMLVIRRLRLGSIVYQTHW